MDQNLNHTVTVKGSNMQKKCWKTEYVFLNAQIVGFFTQFTGEYSYS